MNRRGAANAGGRNQPEIDPGGYRAEVEAAVLAATTAGRAVRDLYDRTATATYAKADGSLLTDADLAADRIVRALLAERFPADAILTEEGVDDPARLAARRIWIVDPIDGTDQFVRRTGDFDVLVALTVAGRPVAAAAYQPTTGVLCAARAGAGSWVRLGDDGESSPLRLAPVADGAAPRLASSIWFGSPENEPALTRVAARLRAGAAAVETIGFSPRVFLPPRTHQLYVGYRPATGHAMGWEWDFAVGDLFLHEAGGVVTDLRGEPLRYNAPDPRNRRGFVAAVDPATHQRGLDALRAELPELLTLA